MVQVEDLLVLRVLQALRPASGGAAEQTHHRVGVGHRGRHRCTRRRAIGHGRAVGVTDTTAGHQGLERALDGGRGSEQTDRATDAIWEWLWCCQ